VTSPRNFCVLHTVTVYAGQRPVSTQLLCISKRPASGGLFSFQGAGAWYAWQRPLRREVTPAEHQANIAGIERQLRSRGIRIVSANGLNTIRSKGRHGSRRWHPPHGGRGPAGASEGEKAEIVFSMVLAETISAVAVQNGHRSDRALRKLPCADAAVRKRRGRRRFLALRPAGFKIAAAAPQPRSLNTERNLKACGVLKPISLKEQCDCCKPATIEKRSSCNATSAAGRAARKTAPSLCRQRPEGRRLV
jgi:hypothetical protein